MKRPGYILLLIVFTIITLSIVQVTVANKLSTNGEELGKIEQEIADYKNQNMVLEEKVLAAQALTTIADKAKKLGFVEAKTPVYLTDPLPLALKE